MDPKKRDQWREEERKASLRRGSEIHYAPLDDDIASDTTDMRRDDGAGSSGVTAPTGMDFRFPFSRNHNDSEMRRYPDNRSTREHDARRRFASTLDTGPTDLRQYSRDPSPHSPGGREPTAGAAAAAPLAHDTEYANISITTPIDATAVHFQERMSTSEEDEDEREKEKARNNFVTAEMGRQGQSMPSWQAQRKTKKRPFGERLAEKLTTAKNFILRRTTTVSMGLGRELPVSANRSQLIDNRTGGPYLYNSIRSSKYTYWSFLPRQLLFQFSKFANIYFLCIAILQMIPGLSTTGTYTTIIPLMAFVTISMIKEGIEDLRRHNLDKAENRAHVERANGLGWDTTEWQQVQVGDILRLKRDDTVPADLVLLHVQGAEDRAYVETMALDGETNLKNKVAPTLLAKMHLSREETLARNDISVHVEDPNLDLYNFNGNLGVGGEKLPLGNDNVLYRGSILRNTEQILGLVVYSGEECKVRMNSNKRPRIKAPRLQSLVNRVVLFIVAIVLFLAVLLSILFAAKEPHIRKAFYIRHAEVPTVQVFVGFIIMLNTMIPLSLYVSMEIVKVWQIVWMNSDIEMYDPVTNTPMEARTSTINEELGQISHVFSDKTGTLTDNIMNFKKLSVAGTAWLHDPNGPEEDYAEYVIEGQSYKRVERPSIEGTPLMGKSEDLLRMIQEDSNSHFARAARFFLLSIALCHTCVSEKDGDGFTYSATSPDEVALAQAAQEMGFVYMDRKAGVVTIKLPSPDGPVVEEIYQVLEVLEFSSKRKRMSMIVRMPDGRTCVFTKGADSIIKELLRDTALTQESTAKVQRRATIRKSMEAQDFIRRKSVQQARYNFARTSKSLARRSIITDADNLASLSPTSPLKADFVRRTNAVDFAMNRRSWHGHEPSIDITSAAAAATTSPTTPRTSSQLPRQFHGRAGSHADEALLDGPASTYEKCFQHIDYFATDGLRTLLYAYRFVDDSEYARWSKIYHEASTSLNDREQRMESAAALIERDLELSGATAIEDKLQEGVPLAIDRLRRANIKVWVLTGDKRETAINIGRSCQLIKDFSTVAIIDHTQGDVFLQVQAALTQMREAVHSVVVIDGQTLAQIQDDEPLFDFFHALAVFVDSVLCCRSSPAQKAFLVKSIRTRVPKSVTLAIGDGANDVAMIQEAHVGIGIAGREGLQAARTADYSIAQFRFLVRLLLVHGRWNYLRVCKYTLATFWKEMLFFLTQAMFQLYTGYTGTSLYESWSLSMFNTLFSSLPVIFLGVFEKDLQAETLMAVPELYNYGQRARGFNLKIYLGWATMSASFAALCYYIPMTLYGQAIFVRDNQLFAFGALCFSAAILVINFKIQFWEIHYKTYFAAISLVAECGGWFLWLLLLSFLYKDNATYKVKGSFVNGFGKSGLWWMTLIVTVAICFAFEMMIKMIRQVVFTNDVDVHQKLEKDPTIWRYIEQAAHAGEIGEEPGSRQLLPPKRTKTQQMRRDAEYESLLTRTRSGTTASRESAENIRKMPAKLVRFLTRDGGDNRSLLQLPTHTPGATPAMTPMGTPGPSWSRAGVSQEDFEMAPWSTGRDPEAMDYYFAPRPDQTAQAKGEDRTHLAP